MDEKTGQNFEVIETRVREKEVLYNPRVSHQTNPIAQKLLDFSVANKTRKFSVRDLFRR